MSPPSNPFMNVVILVLYLNKISLYHHRSDKTTRMTTSTKSKLNKSQVNMEYATFEVCKSDSKLINSYLSHGIKDIFPRILKRKIMRLKPVFFSHEGPKLVLIL